MGEFTALTGELLSLLPCVAGPAVSPGDWVWTVTAAGVLLAISAVVVGVLVGSLQ